LLLAIPVVIFGQGEAAFKAWSTVALIVVTYFFLLGGRFFRQYKSGLPKIREN